ncbi:MAG: DNA-protecting protein DprA [Candidatus Eremiobacteraeota bacterium]|nr:DNA-protecting protein DprA [Candidatus Eremiobacteraeota bacterium]
MDERELGYLLAVAAAGVWSPRAVSAWLNALGTPRALVDYLRAGHERPPKGVEKLSDDARARLSNIDDDAARAALRAAASSRSRIVLRTDGSYPAALRDLCDAPLVLYVRGDLARVGERAVAIVGSRAATAYGRSVACAMASEFAAFGATIVSGLARGVDAAAHRGALDAGTPTVAVLGSGVSALYPHYHALLADEIVERGGAVVSEFAPAQAARAFQFPMRNRIVAALAQATVVVEASTRSGALITARLADELGRSVFAIPGDVGRPTSAGTNALIADGVPLVTSAADIAALVGWRCAIEQPRTSGAQDAVQSALLARLAEPQTVDELAASSSATAAELSSQLVLLELRGLVERGPGGAYAAVRTGTAAKRGA